MTKKKINIETSAIIAIVVIAAVYLVFFGGILDNVSVFGSQTDLRDVYAEGQLELQSACTSASGTFIWQKDKVGCENIDAPVSILCSDLESAPAGIVFRGYCNAAGGSYECKDNDYIMCSL